MRGPYVTTAAKLFDALAAEHLRGPDVSLGRALQNDVLKVNDKIFAFLKDDRLVVKLPAARAAALVAASTAMPFRSGGRTMKEWVSVAQPVEPADGEPWRRLMAESKSYVDRRADGGA